MDVVQEHVEGALHELADEHEQRRLWLSTGADGADVSSWGECVCRLFNDSGLDEALERDGVVYTQPVDDRLTLLRLVLRRVDASQSTDSLLADPALDEVRALAQELLSLLNDLRYRESR